MNSHAITVAASSNSRLQADIMMVRLRRANISCRQISAFFPSDVVPNSVACWLPISKQANFRAGQEAVSCAGALRKAKAGSAGESNAIANVLTSSGIDAMGAHILAEKIGQKHIVLCVHAKNEEQAVAAWHAFRQSKADTVITGRAAARRANAIHQIAPWAPVAA